MRGALVLIALLLTQPAIAYDCIPSISGTDIIFKGKVMAISPSGYPAYNENGNKRLPDKRVTYKVLETYKGEPADSITKVFYYSRSASDSMPQSTKEIRWVYANWDVDKAELTDESCGAVRSPEELAK